MFRNKIHFKFFVCLSLLMGTSHCLSPSKKTKRVFISQEQIDKMDQALSLVEHKDFVKGALMYDELTASLKDKDSKNLMLFNAGTAYKEAGRCETALKRFRKLLDQSLKSPPFKSRALIEISYVYECLGDSESSLLSLKSVEKIRQALPLMINHIVFPARLTIAYAGVGQMTKAEGYKSLSLAKVLESKSSFSSEQELKQKLSRLFYLMGRSYIQKNKIHPPTFFQAFSYHQLYLLQSLFLKDKKWSQLAKNELGLLFSKLHFALKKTKEKKKYKNIILQDINSAKVLIKKEKSKRWTAFYSQLSQPIVKLLSQTP